MIDVEADVVNEQMIEITASIVARYSNRAANGEAVSITVKKDGEADRAILAKPYKAEKVDEWLIT